MFATIIVVIAIFTLMAGSFAMFHMNDGAHANCLAAIPGQPNCVSILDRVKLATTHINALLSASLGIVNSLALALISLLVLLVWVSISEASHLVSKIGNFSRVSLEGTTRSVHKQNRWISLHEKRDPSLMFAVST